MLQFLMALTMVWGLPYSNDEASDVDRVFIVLPKSAFGGNLGRFFSTDEGAFRVQEGAAQTYPGKDSAIVRAMAIEGRTPPVGLYHFAGLSFCLETGIATGAFAALVSRKIPTRTRLRDITYQGLFKILDGTEKCDSVLVLLKATVSEE
jgi:hypothetical protein